MPTLKAITDNRSVGDMVTIDLDIFFDDFAREIEEVPEGEELGFTRHAIISRLMAIENSIQQEVKSVIYRRSSNGHVHVRIFFDHEITVLDAFLIRACLWDDRTRLALDEARYLLTDSLHEMNRCFDEKADAGGIKHAGPWIPLHSCKGMWSPEVRLDFESFDWEAIHKKAEREKRLKVKIKWDNGNVPDELLRGTIGETCIFSISLVKIKDRASAGGRYVLSQYLPGANIIFDDDLDNLKELATHELITWLVKSSLVDKSVDDQWKPPAKESKENTGGQTELGFV